MYDENLRYAEVSLDLTTVYFLKKKNQHLEGGQERKIDKNGKLKRVKERQKQLGRKNNLVEEISQSHRRQQVAGSTRVVYVTARKC